MPKFRKKAMTQAVQWTGDDVVDDAGEVADPYSAGMTHRLVS